MRNLSVFIGVIMLTNALPLVAGQHSYTARDLALAGAFSAQVNDSSSVFVNPAGIAPAYRNDTPIHEVTFSTGRAELSGTTTNDDSTHYNLIYAYTGTEFGLGLAINENDNLFLESANGLASQNISVEEVVATLAYQANSWLKLGATARSLRAETVEVVGAKEDSSKPNYKLGAQIYPWDYNNGGYLFSLKLAATHQTAGEAKPFNLQNAENQNTVVTLLPKSNTVSASFELLSASNEARNSFSISLNIETERREYPEDNNFLVASSNSNAANNLATELRRDAASIEVLKNSENVSYAFRVGMGQIEDPSNSAWSQQQLGFGIGLVYGFVVFDIGYRVSETARENMPDTKEDNVLGTLSFLF